MGLHQQIPRTTHHDRTTFHLYDTCNEIPFRFLTFLTFWDLDTPSRPCVFSPLRTGRQGIGQAMTGIASHLIGASEAFWMASNEEVELYSSFTRG